jgi:hypothetical protein
VAVGWASVWGVTLLVLSNSTQYGAEHGDA